MRRSDFSIIVGLAIAYNYKRQLAEMFEVPETTIERWESGVAKPHPRVEKLIRKTICSWIKEKENA